MSNYNFTDSLSSLDFELLSKDLLEAELGIRFENFREGKDQGIDLRYAPEKGKNVIVQCKRYSEYSDLKRNLKKYEFSKIHKLNPDKYILTTSVSLSPQQADEIKLTLSPFIKSTGDIFGKESLNSILERHQEVERRHIKLWIGSKNILESILHAGTHVVSREEIERAIAAAKIYVHNSSFDEALRILEDQRVCIISGLPGIGKTTLARMLLLYFQEQNFDIIKIERDISEARRVAYHDKPRLYYYDDFLGQTGQADKLNKNEDQALIDFMQSVRASKDSLFVLTTREYILNQAKLHYEKLDRENFEHETCVLDLTKYTRQSKAQILYNHLYFSNLPYLYLEHLVTDDEYLKIIDHKNYNPRIIEHMTSEERINEVSSEEYCARFIEVLDNPVSIWDHAFQNQLSIESRNLLAVLTTLTKEVMLDDIKKAFQNFHRMQCVEFLVPSSPQDFTHALKELEGTFLEIRKVGDTRLVGFKNASIRDFMKNILIEDQWLQKLIESSVFFEQAHWIFETVEERNTEMSLSSDISFMRGIVDRLQSLLEAECCIFEIPTAGQEVLRQEGNPAYRLAYIANATSDLNNKNDSDFIVSGIGNLSDRLELSTLSWLDCWDAIQTFNSLGYLDSMEGRRFVSCLKMVIMRKPFSLLKFRILAYIVAMLPGSFTEVELNEIRIDFIQYVEEFIEEYDYELLNNPEYIRLDASTMSGIGRTLNVDTFDSQQILKEHADKIELASQEQQNWSVSDQNNQQNDGEISDTEINSMFKMLISADSNM